MNKFNLEFRITKEEMANGNKQEVSTEFVERFIFPGAKAAHKTIQDNAGKIAKDIAIGIKEGFEG